MSCDMTTHIGMMVQDIGNHEGRFGKHTLSFEPLTYARSDVSQMQRNHVRHNASRVILLACACVMTIALCATFGIHGTAFADENEPNEIDQQQTPDSSFLYDTTIADLVNGDTSRQDTTVQVTGEVIGDAVSAEDDPGKHWVTLDSLQDEPEGSISVLIDDNDLSQIDTYGDYSSHGTTLRVRGTFHMACQTHAGIIDIHATNVSKVDDGYPTPDALDFNQFVPGILTCTAAALLAILYYFLRERQR